MSTHSKTNKPFVMIYDKREQEYQVLEARGYQKEGLDTDAGSSFSSALQADAKAASGGAYDPTTFNTATDVENALKHLGEQKSESTAEPEKYEPSETLTQALERVENFEKNDYDIYHTGKDGDKTAQSYLDQYKMNLRNKAAGKQPVATNIDDIKAQQGQTKEPVK